MRQSLFSPSIIIIISLLLVGCATLPPTASAVPTVALATASQTPAATQTKGATATASPVPTESVGIPTAEPVIPYPKSIGSIADYDLQDFLQRQANFNKKVGFSKKNGTTLVQEDLKILISGMDTASELQIIPLSNTLGTNLVVQNKVTGQFLELVDQHGMPIWDMGGNVPLYKASLNEISITELGYELVYIPPPAYAAADGTALGPMYIAHYDVINVNGWNVYVGFGPDNKQRVHWDASTGKGVWVDDKTGKQAPSYVDAKAKVPGRFQAPKILKNTDGTPDIYTDPNSSWASISGEGVAPENTNAFVDGWIQFYRDAIADQFPVTPDQIAANKNSELNKQMSCGGAFNNELAYMGPNTLLSIQDLFPGIHFTGLQMKGSGGQKIDFHIMFARNPQWNGGFEIIPVEINQWAYQIFLQWVKTPEYKGRIIVEAWAPTASFTTSGWKDSMVNSVHRGKDLQELMADAKKLLDLGIVDASTLADANQWIRRRLDSQNRPPRTPLFFGILLLH